MKIYIALDMEGITGVVLREQVIPGSSWEYQEARQRYVADTNAAIEGALDAGANEIIVADMHGGGFHLPLADLHPGAKYVLGKGHWPRFPLIEGSDAAFLVGYHAMAGTESAVRDHTIDSAGWQDVWLNGRSVGEVGIDAAIAGHYGVPVMLVTGDDKVCAEARELLGAVETAEVKQGVARHRALVLPPSVAEDVIRSKARRAAERIGEVEAFRVSEPVELSIRYASTDVAEQHPADGETRIRLDGRTVLYRGQAIVDVWMSQM